MAQYGGDDNWTDRSNDKRYLSISSAAKKDLDALYDTADSLFTGSVSSECELKMQGQSFKLRTTVSSVHKKPQPIWFTETLIPGPPRLIFDAWLDRLEWDVFLSKERRLDIDYRFGCDLFLLHSQCKPAAKGLISARDFCDVIQISKCENGLQISSRSVKCAKLPPQKGFVRGEVLLSGVRFERLSAEEIKERNLPALRSGITASACVWTRVRYILQSDIKGWLPASVVNAAMSSTLSGMMRDLRNHIIQKQMRKSFRYRCF